MRLQGQVQTERYSEARVLFDLVPSAAVPCDGRREARQGPACLPCMPLKPPKSRSRLALSRAGKGREGRVAEKPLCSPRSSLAACPGPEDFHRTHKWLRGTGGAVLRGQGVKRQVCMFWEQITLLLKIKK